MTSPNPTPLDRGATARGFGHLAAVHTVHRSLRQERRLLTAYGAFRVEREQLQDLPQRRTTDFVEEDGRVTRYGMFTTSGVLYSAPSRLIGQRLKVRLYSDRLDCYLSGALVLTLAHGVRATITGRARVIDYRHFIEELKRKP